ncbi:threonine-tRNA ligase [Spizellomyces punctatus DAOM BR117]|uniref:threonine--tRNA ligase n=1 Tax=Spizellomyces punctatus (strain DAOM BR117) TaxID=645134 RepID=A0A0L0H874_SPIPD|nr:threonine-tRNA ligase [Spizellomyces punctatus DAOM BR117]KNC97141.1 threonine-tRNA ligase [Spizellomyces punctatus DAOM BR117]|eukprot:XP_016605181.1 threonine-tRNA ligase [Spizellomyces punctatus DAOM BR117]
MKRLTVTRLGFGLRRPVSHSNLPVRVYPLLRLASSYVQQRLAIWDEEVRKDKFTEKSVDIEVHVEGKKMVTGIAGVLTPLDVLKAVSDVGYASDSHLLAVLNKAHPWDLSRPIEASCTLQLIPTHSDSELAHTTLWHSSAHLLGWALEKQFGDELLLCDGPSLKSGGFYYDGLVRRGLSGEDTGMDEIPQLVQPDGQLYNVTDADVRDLEITMKAFAKKKAPFQRLVVSRSVAEHMFRYNPFKLQFLSRIPPTESVTLYRCGDFIDLCRGPHVPHTGYLRAHKLLRTGGAQWDASQGSKHQPLSRIYGIAFSNVEKLRAWQIAQEDAAKRDHRLIAKKQGLFSVNSLAPGSPFMLPHGTRIVQRLMDFLRGEYRRFGYEEVVTPLLFNKDLWVTSGHWENYKEDMFVVGGGHTCGDGQTEGEHEEIHGLKPMNCPGHCLLFANTAKSYRELPVRLAEFSPLHRNEASGALTGLTRVRKFHQDDAHIFCTPAQITSEIISTLQFIDRVYKIFNFPSYELTLSTRPAQNYIGTISQWEDAENQLRTALNATGRDWTIKEGDGAFYGPKIDIMVNDAMGRAHQTATIQLDFQLPQRFGLKYQAEDGGFHPPVIVHRAILGSIERMMAILIEHYAGKWPFWLSPRQAIVIPVGMEYQDYARSVCQELSGRGVDISAGNKRFWYVDVDETDHSLAKRIREAQKAQYNFMLVAGERERASKQVTVRRRDGTNLGTMSLEEVALMFGKLETAFE